MRWLCCLAVAFSLIAVAVSITTWQQADARADAALRRREKALAQKYRPAIERICKDFEVQGPPADSQTLEELFEPLHKLMTALRK